jgi:hypothetical protein
MNLLRRLYASGWIGRSTVFAAFFAITAFILALKGLLTGQYVAVIGTLHVTVTGRAIAEDYHERQMQENSKGKDPS